MDEDPDQLPDDAVPLWEPAGALLPLWYMPAAVRPLRGWARWVVLLIIASFLLINAYGLCSTYGSVGIG